MICGIPVREVGPPGYIVIATRHPDLVGERTHATWSEDHLRNYHGWTEVEVQRERRRRYSDRHVFEHILREATQGWEKEAARGELTSLMAPLPMSDAPLPIPHTHDLGIEEAIKASPHLAPDAKAAFLRVLEPFLTSPERL